MTADKDQRNGQRNGEPRLRRLTMRVGHKLGRLVGRGGESSLREQIEDVIDEAEEAEEAAEDTASTGSAPTNRTSDMSPVERKMLRNLLHFGETQVDDVAVPRADIIAVSETASFDELVDIFVTAGHSRLPVYRDSLDKIVGMIHVKDVFAVLAMEKTMQKATQARSASGDGGDSAESGDIGASTESTEVTESTDKPVFKPVPKPAIADLLRQPRYVPQSMSVLDLLADMRDSRTHLAIIIDEYSGTEGLVTIEDLVEEIVGEIEDEYDETPAALITKADDGVWVADARAELTDVGELVDSALVKIDEDVDTLGGLAAVLAGHLPAIGEIIDHPSGWRIEITGADERRVTHMRLHAPRESQSPPAE